LQQRRREGGGAEKIAENILEDLLVDVLGWKCANINYQMGYADLVLTRFGIKQLIIEVKRPYSLAWHKKSIHRALEQARRYADTQKVRSIAISDGVMLYAADIESGELRNRVHVSLVEKEFPDSLWWLSEDGIYRPCPKNHEIYLPLFDKEQDIDIVVEDQSSQNILLHPKYKLPPECFAYVGNFSKTSTWKLPYRKADGSIDTKRLPKAVQCIVSNYRGATVKGIPEEEIATVLVKLGRAVKSIGKMPSQIHSTSLAYQNLADALRQFGKLGDIS